MTKIHISVESEHRATVVIENSRGKECVVVGAGEQVAIEAGAFRLVAVLAFDEDVVSGRIDPHTDAQLAAVLAGIKM